MSESADTNPQPGTHKEEERIYKKQKKETPLKGNNTHKIPPPSGRFLLPPPIPKYYEENGLRKVKPYWYVFNAYAKQRWQGRTLIDVYGEFKTRGIAYFEWAIKTGAITVNNQQATSDTILRNGDLISNITHRHEPPVVGGPIKILHRDEEMLVVEKPGSMPVHATGRYNFNTLLSILKYDYGLDMVYTSNRLDRLTSGVMVCALTKEASRKIGAWFGGQRQKDGGVKKEYVARVVGRFPEGEVVCEEPLLSIDRQIGVNIVHPEGRHAKTIFYALSYDERSNTTAVRCIPITGRTHQIRVHLQYLGHPIANDPMYVTKRAWGSDRGKGGVLSEDEPPVSEEDAQKLMAQKIVEENAKRREKIMQAQMKIAASAVEKEYNEVREFERNNIKITARAEGVLDALREMKDEADGFSRQRDSLMVDKAERLYEKLTYMGEESLNTDADSYVDDNDGLGPYCPACFTPLMEEPRTDQLFIWLHSLRYTTTEWSFSSELPEWARPDYVVPLDVINNEARQMLL